MEPGTLGWGVRSEALLDGLWQVVFLPTVSSESPGEQAVCKSQFKEPFYKSCIIIREQTTLPLGHLTPKEKEETSHSHFAQVTSQQQEAPWTGRAWWNHTGGNTHFCAL